MTEEALPVFEVDGVPLLQPGTGSHLPTGRCVSRNEKPLRVADERVFADFPSICDRDVRAPGNAILVDIGIERQSSNQPGRPHRNRREEAFAGERNGTLCVLILNPTWPALFTGRNVLVTIYMATGRKQTQIAIPMIPLSKLTWKGMITLPIRLSHKRGEFRLLRKHICS